MTRQEIARWRMRNQHLWGTPLKTPEEVVRWLGAMQSQEFSMAKWSVAQRADGISDTALDQAFAKGTILRTHVVRPTWHFVLPEDIRWMLELTGPRVNALNAYYYKKFGLDDGVFARTQALFSEALEGGVQLVRKELGAVLHRAGIAASGLRLGYILMRAELDAVICSGALRGKQRTYALFDDRVPRSKTPDRDEALAEFTRRYFTSRGPATLKDYRTWSSLTAADCKAGLEMVKSQLEHEVVGDRTYWFVAPPPGTNPDSPVIDLVQGYDEVVMSYSESKDVLHRSETTSGVPQGQAPLLHAILLDGQLIGHWKRIRKSKAVFIEAYFYRSLKDDEKDALAASADRYGRFLGVPATLL